MGSVVPLEDDGACDEEDRDDGPASPSGECGGDGVVGVVDVVERREDEQRWRYGVDGGVGGCCCPDGAAPVHEELDGDGQACAGDDEHEDAELGVVGVVVPEQDAL